MLKDFWYPNRDRSDPILAEMVADLVEKWTLEKVVESHLKAIDEYLCTGKYVDTNLDTLDGAYEVLLTRNPSLYRAIAGCFMAHQDEDLNAVAVRLFFALLRQSDDDMIVQVLAQVLVDGPFSRDEALALLKRASTQSQLGFVKITMSITETFVRRELQGS